jgi:hypothetical protein
MAVDPIDPCRRELTVSGGAMRVGIDQLANGKTIDKITWAENIALRSL